MARTTVPFHKLLGRTVGNASTVEAAHHQLLEAIYQQNVNEIASLAATIDLNLPCNQEAGELEGGPVLFVAVLEGDLEIVRLLLDHGADPNYVAREPAASVYAPRVLDLAEQARFLLDHDKFDPIVELLKAPGAEETRLEDYE